GVMVSITREKRVLMTEQELIEQLADKEHASWARWQDYFFSKCHMYVEGEHLMYSRDKVYFSLPRELVERWRRQVDTPYAELSEQEKQSDREEVKHILPIIEEYKLRGDLIE